jgi:hypothetical protein
MMGHYRNHPGGMAGMSEDITRTTRHVAFEDILATGNRAQRRWAKRKLTEQLRQQAEQEQRLGKDRCQRDGGK